MLEAILGIFTESGFSEITYKNIIVIGIACIFTLSNKKRV